MIETSRRQLVFILLAILLVRVVALYLARTELYFDEAQYWAWSKELAFGYFTKPPLLAWIIAGFTSVCGDGEPCVRLSAPVLDTLTAALIYMVARKLYDERTAFWSAIVFATLPAISLSNTVISTDVPLLLCFTAALLALLYHIEKPTLLTGVALGVAIGLGLNAKYAMAYFFLCLAVYFFVAPDSRRILRAPSTWLALGIAALLIAPNILWNAQHQFQTIKHVGANASWNGGIHPMKALEFFGSQFAVLGPVIFCIFLAALFGRMKNGNVQAGRFLLSFSTPVILLLIFQALMSRALANWAAAAFPAITILATALLLEWRRLFNISLSLHVIAALMLAAGPIYALQLRTPSGELVYKRMLGWNEIAQAVARHAQQQNMPVIAVDGRAMAAEMLYYLRDAGLDIRGALTRNEVPTDHFQLTRPWHYGDSAALLVTWQDTKHFWMPENYRKQIATLPTARFLSPKPYSIYYVREAPGP